MVAEFRRRCSASWTTAARPPTCSCSAAILAGSDRIVVPQPVDDYTTSRVLTMDYVDGRSIDSPRPARPDRAGRRRPWPTQLFGAYLDQILVHGFFHADPHPGNVLLTADDRLALIDLGMVARLSPEAQDQLLRLLLAISQRGRARRRPTRWSASATGSRLRRRRVARPRRRPPAALRQQHRRRAAAGRSSRRAGHGRLGLRPAARPRS